MGVIIGFSGKKQSGKNTACNLVFGLEMSYIKVVQRFRLNTKGELIIGVFDEDKNEFDEFKIDPLARDSATINYLEEKVKGHIKVYSFADLLKKNICIDVLGLTDEQCYGTDEDKDTKTHLSWSDMPDGFTNITRGASLNPDYINANMTAREVMQYVGTNIFRQMYGEVWVDGLMRRIEKDNPAIALVADVRFPNEVAGIQKAAGKVIRLTRGEHSTDAHASETALDIDNYDWDNFNAVLDNSLMSIGEQNVAICKLLAKWSYLPDGLELLTEAQE